MAACISRDLKSRRKSPLLQNSNFQHQMLQIRVDARARLEQEVSTVSSSASNKADLCELHRDRKKHFKTEHILKTNKQQQPKHHHHIT